MFTSKLFTLAVTHWNTVTSWNTSGSGHIVGCQWDNLRLCYKSCTSVVKTEQDLVQVIIDTLPYVVCKIVCISFVKKRLVLRDKNELVRRCCCGRGDICSAKTIMIGWCIYWQYKSLEKSTTMWQIPKQVRYLCTIIRRCMKLILLIMFIFTWAEFCFCYSPVYITSFSSCLLLLA